METLLNLWFTYMVEPLLSLRKKMVLFRKWVLSQKQSLFDGGYVYVMKPQ